MATERDRTSHADEPTDRRVTRRWVLATAGTGAASAVAGCSSGESDTDRPTDEPSAPPPTETPSPEPTDAPTAAGFDASLLRDSPSSHVAPADGFAAVDWLDGADPAVVKVTSLDASGEGSLRWALDRPGTRVVVFEVGGVVDLGGEHLTIGHDDVFVAGQTAPAPGIIIVRGAVGIEADNVVLQHLRVRPGDDLPGPVDCVTNRGANVVVDHCSASWGTDETISTTAGETNAAITFSNNLMAECLVDSIHPKGSHSMGTLLNDRSERVTVAGNLWAHNVGRHPRIKGGTSAVVANNVAYNYDRGTNLGGGVDDETVASIVGNYYRAGPDTDTEDPVIGTTYTDARGPITAFIAYNATDPSSIPVTKSIGGMDLVTERPLWPERLNAVRGAAAYERVRASAGARPAERTPHDERILGDVRGRTGSPIDSQNEVGGYPDLESTRRELTVPDTGLGAWLREFTVAVERPDE